MSRSPEELVCHGRKHPDRALGKSPPFDWLGTRRERRFERLEAGGAGKGWCLRWERQTLCNVEAAGTKVANPVFTEIE